LIEVGAVQLYAMTYFSWICAMDVAASIFRGFEARLERMNLSE
jgi:hypothetical protein